MDIVQACPNTAMLIYQYLIKSECKHLQTGLKPLENKRKQYKIIFAISNFNFKK